DRAALGGIDDLANAEQRVALGDAEKFGAARISGGGVDFFIGISDVGSIVALQNAEKGFAAKRCGDQAGEIAGGQVAGLESKRLVGGQAEALDLDETGPWGKGKAGGGFMLFIAELGHQDLGTAREAPAGHLFGVAHQLIEVDLGGGNKSA